MFLMEHYDEAQHINVGTGEDLSIRELAEMVREVVHPGAALTFDTSKPDGTPRKLLDVSRLHALGLAPPDRPRCRHQGDLRVVSSQPRCVTRVAGAVDPARDADGHAAGDFACTGWPVIRHVRCSA